MKPGLTHVNGSLTRMHATLRRSRTFQESKNMLGDMSPVKRSDVRRVDRVQQIPCGKDPVSTGAQPRVDHWT